MKHTNNGACGYCHELILKYPGFYSDLLNWFMHFQNKHPECHVACAGRGQVEQEAAFHRGASHAHYGSSSHNYNAALDLWVMIDGKYMLPKEWFTKNLEPALPPWVEWFGAVGSPYYELPHIQIRGWSQLVKNGILKLVE